MPGSSPTIPVIPPVTIADVLDRLEAGGALLPDSPSNVMEVVGVLKSYGVVLDAYAINLCYIADHQFLVLFPFFKYFDGEVTFSKLLRHWWHDRINYEYAEYCMKAMLWHGSEGLDGWLDSEAFCTLAEQAIQAKLRGNPIMQTVHRLFPNFLLEQVRQLAYYSGLGQFWRVMSDLFIDLSDRYDRGEIKTIPEVVAHIQAGLVAAAANPITYQVEIGGKSYDLIPPSAQMTFLKDVAVPYVEAVFFRSFPFFGTISYNAQAGQIPSELAEFNYGALYADPLPIGGAGIPPTLLMQDMRHYLPDYLSQFYDRQQRRAGDLRVQICDSFQKSMFCVTTAAIKGLMPYSEKTRDPAEQEANRTYLKQWLTRLQESCLLQQQKG